MFPAGSLNTSRSMAIPKTLETSAPEGGPRPLLRFDAILISALFNKLGPNVADPSMISGQPDRFAR